MTAWDTLGRSASGMLFSRANDSSFTFGGSAAKIFHVNKEKKTFNYLTKNPGLKILSYNYKIFKMYIKI